MSRHIAETLNYFLMSITSNHCVNHVIRGKLRMRFSVPGVDTPPRKKFSMEGLERPWQHPCKIVPDRRHSFLGV
jgi:hypothetical protein